MAGKEFLDPEPRVQQLLSQLLAMPDPPVSAAAQKIIDSLREGAADVREEPGKESHRPQTQSQSPPPSPPRRPPSPPASPPPPPSGGGDDPDDPNRKKKGLLGKLTSGIGEMLGFKRTERKEDLGERLEGMGQKQQQTGGSKSTPIRNIFNFLHEMAGGPPIDKMKEASRAKQEDLRGKIGTLERRRAHEAEVVEQRRRRAERASEKYEAAKGEETDVASRLAKLGEKEQKTKDQYEKAQKGLEEAKKSFAATTDPTKKAEQANLANTFDAQVNRLNRRMGQQQLAREKLEKEREELPNIERLGKESETAENRLFHAQERHADLTDKLEKTNRELMEEGRKHSQIGRTTARETGEHLFRVARGLGQVAEGLKGPTGSASAAKIFGGVADTLGNLVSLLPGGKAAALAGQAAVAPLKVMAAMDSFSNETMKENLALAKYSPHIAVTAAQFEIGTMLLDMKKGARVDASFRELSSAKLERMESEQYQQSLWQNTKNRAAAGWESFMARANQFTELRLRSGGGDKAGRNALNAGFSSPADIGAAAWSFILDKDDDAKKREALLESLRKKQGDGGENAVTDAIYNPVRTARTATIGEEFIMAGKEAAGNVMQRGHQEVARSDWQANLDRPNRFGDR